MINTALTICFLGMMLVLTSCATTDSNGFVTPSVSNVSTNTSGTLLQPESDANALAQQEAFEDEMYSMPVDNSNQW